VLPEEVFQTNYISDLGKKEDEKSTRDGYALLKGTNTTHSLKQQNMTFFWRLCEVLELLSQTLGIYL
jgi:hypothetical protein